MKVSRDHDITKAVSWTLITQNHVCDSFLDCEETQHFDFVLAPKEFIAEAGRGIFGGSHGFQVDHMIFKGNEAITKTGPKVSFIPQYHS